LAKNTELDYDSKNSFKEIHFGKKEKEIPAGGPCTYKEDIYPARLIKLVTNDSISYDVHFSVTRNNGAGTPDTVNLHFINNSYIKAEQVKADSIAVGKTYKLVDQTILTGSCNPHVQSIKLEKYQ